MNRTSIVSEKSSPNWNVMVTFRSKAKRLLARFEELQELHIADRDRLETELVEVSK